MALRIEHTGEAFAQLLDRCRLLLLADLLVLLLICRGLEALPREGATEEVHENVGKGLEVVPTGLLNTQVSVDGRVAGGTRQVLVLPVRDVQVRLRVPVLLRETEVDDVDLVTALANAHQEVVGLNVTVYEVAGVNVFDARNLYDAYHVIRGSARDNEDNKNRTS